MFFVRLCKGDLNDSFELFDILLKDVARWSYGTRTSPLVRGNSKRMLQKAWASKSVSTLTFLCNSAMEGQTVPSPWALWYTFR